MDDFVGRQRIIISWLLAISVGVLGNLAISLLFRFQLFQFSLFSVFVLSATFGAIVLLTLIIFLLYPTNCKFSFTFLPLLVEIEEFHSKLQKEKLSPEASLFFPSGDSSYDSYSLNIVVGKFARAVSLAILRDRIKQANNKLLCVSEINLGTSSLGLYALTFDLKHRYSFWNPANGEKIRKELQTTSENIMEAKITVSVYGIDKDETRWSERGHIFLNEIAKLDLDNLMEKIKGQIVNRKPKPTVIIENKLKALVKRILSNLKGKSSATSQ